MYRVCQGRGLTLASASPRRRDLLSRSGLEFRIAPVDIDEALAGGESAERNARRLALAKARAAEAPAPGEALLAADTLVAVDHRILGKPADRVEAAEMLGLLAGREHRVVTGFALRVNGGVSGELAVSRVWFRKLSAAEIAAYVATGEPMGKAGAYAIQGIGAALVERVEGSYTNVVGLPLAAIIKLLLQHGVIEPREG